tara:strand:- start:1356 stop:2033 length:678 start_codon:yes stop_codon:yes gene_type:complete
MVNKLLFKQVKAKTLGYHGQPSYSEEEFIAMVGMEGYEGFLDKFIERKAKSIPKVDISIFDTDLLLERYEPNDDLGEKILDEAEKNSIGAEDVMVALRYFRNDFDNSLMTASKYLTKAEQQEYNSEGRKQGLKETYKFIARVHRSLEIIQQIFPWFENDEHFEEPFNEALQYAVELETRYRLVLEFPNSFKQKRDLEKAVEEERYEDAGKLRDEINRLTDQYLKE